MYVVDGWCLVYLKIETSCNVFFLDVYMGYRTSQNECLCIFGGETDNKT